MTLHSTSPLPFPASGRYLHLHVDVLAGIVRVGGALDSRAAHHVVDAVSALRSGPGPTWTLDFHAVTSCDDEGLSVIERAWLMAQAAGRRLRLVRMPPELADQLLVFRCRRAAAPGPLTSLSA